MKKISVDKKLLISILLLVGAGFLIFLSASLGLLARDSVHFGSATFKQIFFGLLPGLALLYIFSIFDYMKWRKLAFLIFAFSIVLNIIIFLPHVGLSHGGATRWLSIGSFSFQVSEVLKIAAIIYFAAWLSLVKEGVKTWKRGFLPLFIMLAIVGALCLMQKDTDTLIVVSISLISMFVVAGGKWRHIALLVFSGGLVFAMLVYERPYIRARIITFFDPGAQSLTTGWQIQQSLIAIGSGGITGRGFGQSIQKFNYLPEPVGDSIFAVAAEEFGFVGSFGLIILFVFFTMRVLKVAGNANHPFGTFFAVGIVTYIIVQSFVNIGSMVGVIPLSGTPLLFVSQGGTALLFVLAEAGILLNISKSAKMVK